MKIAIITNTLGRGGSEKQIRYILQTLSTTHKFMVIQVGCETSKRFDLRKFGVANRHFNLHGIFIKPSVMFNFMKLWWYLKSENPDVIHSWLFRSNCVAAIIKLLSNRPRLITSKRGSNYWYKKKHFLVNKLVYRMSERIVVNTRTLKEEILAYNTVGDKITVIPNGIDLELTSKTLNIKASLVNQKKRGKTIIGCVGRFVSVKRYEDVIQACERLIKEHSNIHFVLVGGRGDIERYRRLVVASKLDDYITFTGEVTEIMPILKGFDVFLNVSSSEGMPNAVMEAMLLGKPIIATKVGGVTDLIEDGKNGILVPPYRPDKIVEAIKTLLGDKKLQRRFASNNKKKIREFSLEKMIANVAAMYDEVLSK